MLPTELPFGPSTICLFLISKDREQEEHHGSNMVVGLYGSFFPVIASVVDRSEAKIDTGALIGSLNGKWIYTTSDIDRLRCYSYLGTCFPSVYPERSRLWPRYLSCAHLRSRE